MTRPNFVTGKAINLEQLDDELGGHGLCMNAEDSTSKIVAPADGSPVTQAQLAAAIDDHDAQPVPEPTLEERLASVGLDLDELRAALA